MFLWAPLSGKYGRRTVLLPGCVAYTAIQVATAFAPNIGTLLALRLLGGAFAACQLAVPRIIVFEM